MGDPSALAEITVVTKIGDPLTKRISLADNEQLISDGSACTMSRGSTRRWFGNVHQFAELLERLGSQQAMTLGRIEPNLADEVEIVTKCKLNGAFDPRPSQSGSNRARNLRKDRHHGNRAATRPLRQGRYARQLPGAPQFHALCNPLPQAKRSAAMQGAGNPVVTVSEMGGLQ
jgi:hypothetical protein